VQDYSAGALPIERSISDPAAGLHSLPREQEWRKRVRGWRRTQRDSFEGEWELITSWVMVNPERDPRRYFSGVAAQRLTPGCYQPPQIRPLGRGMRKIRANLLDTVEEQWQTEVIPGTSPFARGINQREDLW
jgi:hypothetical protein